MSINSYDFIAPFYDPLSSLLLGNSYRQSKHTFFECITPNMNIWCLGGGTGNMLPTLLSMNAPNGKVIYTESSQKMLELAKKRVPEQQTRRVIFHYNDTFDWPISARADMIICQYFLDVLTDFQLNALFSKLGTVTHPATRMLFVDFYPLPSKSLLLYTMIHTFGWATGHPRKDLPDYAYYFTKYGWVTDEERNFENGFIKAKCLVREI